MFDNGRFSRRPSHAISLLKLFCVCALLRNVFDLFDWLNSKSQIPRLASLFDEREGLFQNYIFFKLTLCRDNEQVSRKRFAFRMAYSSFRIYLITLSGTIKSFAFQ